MPAGKIRYDNLKAAVAQVIGFSRQRVETDRWVAFRSHFDIDAFYCQPGINGAHEKGGVEGDIGRFRRNHLVPIPEVESLHELNELVDGYDRADDTRRVGHRAHTVAEAFSANRRVLSRRTGRRRRTSRLGAVVHLSCPAVAQPRCRTKGTSRARGNRSTAQPTTCCWPTGCNTPVQGAHRQARWTRPSVGHSV